MLEHLECVLRPDGTVPLLGDDDGGRVVPLDCRDYLDGRPTLAVGACLLGRPPRTAPGEEVLWLLGPDAVARFEPANQPAQASRAFPSGGVYVLREASNVLTIECGAQGGAHDHADVLGLELAVAGRALLVDPGTYSYLRGDGLGDPFRETKAHNTVVVDGEPSSVPAGPFGWRSCARGTVHTWVTTEHFDFFEGVHDGYTRLEDPVVHSRSVLFVKRGYWIIRDRLVASGSHRYDLHFHLAVGVQPTLREGTPQVLEAGFARLVTLGDGSWSIDEGYVSRRYGSRERAAVATFTSHARGTCELVTFVFPRMDDTCAE
jgi:heparinase II/III-like protein